MQTCEKEWRISRDLSLDNIINQIEQRVSNRHTLNHLCGNMAFVSKIEPISIHDDFNDEKWIEVMHDELN